MTWLLDTNILIYLMKHKPPAVVERIASVSDDDIVAMPIVRPSCQPTQASRYSSWRK